MKARTISIVVTAALAGLSLPVVAQPGLTHVPAANKKAPGYAPADVLSPELRQRPVAGGSTALENPEGITGWYGYQNDAPSAADPSLPQMVPGTTPGIEAQKTEPDKNVYLVLRDQKGADRNYEYGTHFLFQGHELGSGGQAYLTRINLDADAAHRVTLMATHDIDGKPIAPIDGASWDPFSQRLLFTTENPSAPTYAATASFPSQVEDVSGALGRGGYEGIQADSYGNLWLVEDIGGASKRDDSGASTAARRPNSYVYRYVPRHPGDLHDGKLQVLQVVNGDHPVTFESQAALNSPDQLALHTYGMSFRTRWVTIHDTGVDGNAPFNANALAKAAQGTPFKRPENGVFRPGTFFREFYFDETGDTNAASPENGTAGGWSSIFKLTQANAAADNGVLALFFQSRSATVAGLDNIQFLSADTLLVVEDAGDTLHAQRNALDSGWAFDVNHDYADGDLPVRFLAEGRDASATLDAANGGFGRNEGDNEITGIHVSDGDATIHGVLGAKLPRFGRGDWRWFWTQQHGDNVTWEVTPAPRKDDDDRDGRGD